MSDIKLKYKIIDYLENKCSNSKLSRKTLGTYIRALHICGPLNIWLAMLYISKPISIFFIIILFILLFFFYIFDGCILTMLERKLCGDTFTFIDPFLEHNSLELNTKNRYNMSIKVAIIYILITLIIFSYRFLL
jgi:hypothetical protein